MADAPASFGLVDEVVEDGTAVGRAIAVGQRIARAAPDSITEILRAIRRISAEAEQRGWAISEAAAEAITHAPDHAEGIAAFFERREPLWSG